MELKRIWMEVKNKYQMRLAAGRKGLERQIDWVHIIEDVQVAEFLRGGELVFTTGIVVREEYLLELGKRLWKKEACGLAVNLGPYIGRVPEELLEFGDKKGFPIFTIPWEIRLVDVTRALTTRLNEYEQTEKTLNQAVENAIFRSAVPELYLPYMMRCGYPEEANYQIAVIDVERIRKDCSQSRRICGMCGRSSRECRFLWSYSGRRNGCCFCSDRTACPSAGSEWSGSCRWAGTGIWASRPGSAQW